MGQQIQRYAAKGFVKRLFRQLARTRCRDQDNLFKRVKAMPAATPPARPKDRRSVHSCRDGTLVPSLGFRVSTKRYGPTKACRGKTANVEIAVRSEDRTLQVSLVQVS